MSHIQPTRTHGLLGAGAPRRLALALAAGTVLALAVALAAGGGVIGGGSGDGTAANRTGLPEAIAPGYIVPEHSIVVR